PELCAVEFDVAPVAVGDFVGVGEAAAAEMFAAAVGGVFAVGRGLGVEVALTEHGATAGLNDGGLHRPVWVLRGGGRDGGGSRGRVGGEGCGCDGQDDDERRSR